MCAEIAFCFGRDGFFCRGDHYVFLLCSYVLFRGDCKIYVSRAEIVFCFGETASLVGVRLLFSVMIVPFVLGGCIFLEWNELYLV